jgi:hypothetical protein
MLNRLNKISRIIRGLEHSRKSNVVMLSTALMAMLAAPAFGQEAGTSQSNNPVTDLEVIEISGIRGSLNAAANAKRFDSRIVD